MTETEAERLAQAARTAWALMSDLVLDNQRRHDVSAAVGLPFSRVRALRRVAAAPVTLRDLATLLAIDPPNCTVVVDDLEQRGLVERRANPADRRSKLVVTTASGTRLARQAQRLLDEPPAALQRLAPHDLTTLAEILTRIDAPGSGAGSA